MISCPICSSRPNSPARILRILYWLLFVLYPLVICGQGTAADTPLDAAMLEPGKPITREIAGGQTHRYKLKANEGE